MSKSLGKFEKVDIRALWPHEAADFTPWLAKDENLKLLGDAIGIELKVKNTEVSVGPYSADIVAEDVNCGDDVVIENQLGKTNHDHLGKLITYAANLDAKTLVWIAPDFTDEHRRAVDWLNKNAPEDVSFYGVSLELWRIDDSRPAVKFNIVARPPVISTNSAAAAASGELSETRRLQLEWWTAFRQALLDRKVLPSARSPRPQYWYDVPLGRTGIIISNIANTDDNKIGIRVYLIQRLGGDNALSQLMQWKSEIEKEIGESLLWNPNPENRDKTIALYRDADLNRRDRWGDYLDWMVSKTVLFRKAFSPRIKQLATDIAENDHSEV